MEIALDPQDCRYLSNKIRSGKYKSASDVVKHALSRLKQDEKDQVWLKRELQKGIDSLDRGEGSAWDLEEEKARLLRRFRRQRSKA